MSMAGGLRLAQSLEPDRGVVESPPWGRGNDARAARPPSAHGGTGSQAPLPSWR